MMVAPRRSSRRGALGPASTSGGRDHEWRAQLLARGARRPLSLLGGSGRPWWTCLLALAVLGSAHGSSVCAAPRPGPPSPAPDARDGANFTRHLDVRQADGHPDHLGLDFDLRFEKHREDSSDVRHAYSLLVVAKGFQTFDRAIPDANSMTGDLSLQGSFFAVDLTPLSERERRRHAELSDKLPEAEPPGPGLTPEERVEFDALDAELFGHRPSLWTYDLHYRIETNHDASRSQQVFGAGGALEVPLLHSLLDLAPSILRSPSYWRPQPVRAYVAAEYISPEQDSVLAFAAGKLERLWRVRWESAWRTRVAAGVDMRAEARVDWLLDAPAFVRDAGREFNAFVQVWLLYPLRPDGTTGVMIKYMDGRLAPGYGSVSGGKVGLTIGLGRN